MEDHSPAGDDEAPSSAPTRPRRTSTAIVGAVVAVLLGVGGFALIPGCGGDDDDGEVDATGDDTTTSTPLADTTDPVIVADGTLPGYVLVTEPTGYLSAELPEAWGEYSGGQLSDDVSLTAAESLDAFDHDFSNAPGANMAISQEGDPTGPQDAMDEIVLEDLPCESQGRDIFSTEAGIVVAVEQYTDCDGTDSAFYAFGGSGPDGTSIAGYVQAPEADIQQILQHLLDTLTVRSGA